MQTTWIRAAEAASLFCRLNLNVKKDLPIRSSEMGLLIWVTKAEAPATSVAAADFFKVSKPMIATMVAALTKKGYLEKTRSAEDRRSYGLRATERGYTLVEEAYREYFRVMELLQTRMGGEFDALIALLEKANEILLEEKQNG